VNLCFVNCVFINRFPLASPSEARECPEKESKALPTKDAAQEEGHETVKKGAQRKGKRRSELGCEADHSLPTSVEVKKNGSIHPLPHAPL
jgi:hypothetical protein